MSEFVVEEAHLASLLDGASSNIAKATRHSLRLAALELIDYYHAIAKEAAKTAGYDLDASSVGYAIESVIAHLRLTNVGYLGLVNDIRTKIAHGEHHEPPAKHLNMLLEKAPKTREVWQKSAHAVKTRLEGLGELPKALVQSAESLRARLDNSLNVDWKAKHMPMVEAAMATTAASPEELDKAGIFLLIEIREFLANLEGYGEAMDDVHGVHEGPDEDYYEDYPDEPEPDYEEPDYDYDPGETELDSEPAGPSETDSPNEEPVETEPNEEPRESDDDPDVDPS